MATPWGAATVVDELALRQQAGERRFSSLVQLLEAPGGERLVRFAYSTGGSARRGPVTLRARDLEKLRDAARRRGPSWRRRWASRRRRLGRRCLDGELRTTTEPRRRATRGSARRRRSRAAGSTACSGCGISPKTLPLGVDDAGHVRDRAVRVVRLGVAEDDLPVLLELGEQLRVGEPAALAVLHGDRQRLPLRAAGRERRVRPLDRRAARRGTRTRATRSGAARRAAAGPRRGPGSRCRSRARARPRRRSGSPRPSPARSWRSRRSAGSRRTRSRPAARPRPRRAAAGSACQTGTGLGADRLQRPGGVAVVARAREGDDGDPRAPAHACRPARSRSSRSAGSRAAGGTSARRSSRALAGSACAELEVDHAADARLADLEAEVAQRARRPPRPAGRGCPASAGRGRSPSPEHGRRVGEVVVERDPGQALERLDVARARPGDDVVRAAPGRDRSCPSRVVSQ